MTNFVFPKHNIMRLLFSFTITMLITLNLSGQVSPNKYWIRFTDKNNSPYSIENPEQFLTQRAIDRRIAQDIDIVENDLPVIQSYIDAVAGAGATVLTVSKWMNSVTVYTTNPAVITTIEGFSFVLSTQKIAEDPDSNSFTKPFFKNETIEKPNNTQAMNQTKSGQSFDYGSAFNQINMLNGIGLHDLGFDGTGMVIAVLDAGFLNADNLAAFDSLWMNGQILGTKDFVSPASPNIFGSHSHGTHVLSTIGTNLPGQMVGTAPHADFWLLRSEDAATEYLIEELNWVSAAEFADSVGADVINSSLIYTTFNNSAQDHTYADMDGNTTPITIGADMAASKGILVVNAAGNDGNNSWYYMGAPADGDSVFTIGAVNSSGNTVSFSSHGPTADGQTKPDVVAQGSGTYIVSASTGNVTTGSGTSYASPITAGMVTCLWSAFPDRKNTEIMQAIRESASQYATPDENLGFGIPDYMAAYDLLDAATIHSISPSIKVFIEGAFDGSQMSTSINSLLPLEQPFNIAPFFYSGDEVVESIPSADIVDWVLLELRDAGSANIADQSTIVARQAVFLKSDGSITDTSGVALPEFNIPITDSLFAVIHHRNHLSIISAVAIKDAGSGIYPYDFTTAIDKVFGINGYKMIAPGIYGMVSGEMNGDGQIDENDLLDNWGSTAGNNSYLPGDLNLDGEVDNIDKDDFWFINQTLSSQVPD